MREYGLIGYPLGHSFSGKFFSEKFSREGLQCVYSLFPMAEISGLPALMSSHPRLMGLNVTIPHKESVLPYLDSLSDDARQIGAVNVIKIRDGKLEGFNSDWLGFAQSLRPLLRPDVRNALIIGTGGAAKAVAYALRKLGIAVTFVSRNPDAAMHADKSGTVRKIIGYCNLDEMVMAGNRLIVNCTPLGTYPEVIAAPDIPYYLITARHICHDLVYNPEMTEFMRRCAGQGATVKNGLEMLRNQALLSWEIWMRR